MTKAFDLVILGATGYTGQFVVEELARIRQEIPTLQFAIAGRNAEKLNKTLETARSNTGLELKDVAVIVADVNDPNSVVSMAKQAKVVINCVGPYRYYGETIVKSCIEGGADHVDISGEPQYLEHMQLAYSEAAVEKNVHIVGACGFDSIPADMGTVFLQNNFKGDVNSVEMVVGMDESSEGSSTINFTTMECAVLGISNIDALKKIRKELFKEQLPRSSHRPMSRRSLFWSNDAERWCVPNMASDKSVVMRTQRINYEISKKRPAQFSAYFGMQSFWTAFSAIVFGIIFGTMTSFSFTRNLLLKFPEFFTFGTFTRAGPKRDDLKKLKFCVALTGYGWNTTLDDPDQQHTDKPNVKKTVKLVGPDPGYFGTAMIVTQCALTVLQEKDKLPKSGGVFTPGSAFLNTTLIERLQTKGVSFTMIEE